MRSGGATLVDASTRAEPSKRCWMLDVGGWISRQNIASERGHVGPTVSGILGIAAAVVASIGIHGGSDTLEIIGVALFGAAIVGATAVPHLWLRKVWRRIDRITDESDPDKHVGRDRIEL